MNEAQDSAGRFFPSWRGWAGYSGLVLVSVWLHLALHTYAFDDAYIHFRVAEQLIRTGAPYYNAGQAVMASSSAVWSLLLGLLFLVSGPLPWIVATLNGVISATAAVIFGALMRELTRGEAPRWLCWAFVLPAFSWIHYASVGLMETGLALAVLGLACLLYARGRGSAFVLLGAAPFLRPELAVFTLLFLIPGAIRAPSGLIRRLLFTAAGGLPFVVYQLFYFGTIVPHTVVAKSEVYALSYADSFGLLRRVVGAFSPWQERSWGLAVDVVLLLAVLVLAGAGEWTRRRRPDERTEVVYLLGLGGLLIGAAYVGARGLVFPWYAPLVALPPGFALYVLAGRTRWRAAYAVLLLSFGLPHAAVVSRSVAAAASDPGLYRYFFQNARVRSYLAVGQRLYEQYPRARLLAPEIGGLGFTFRAEVIDAVGLVSPQALHFHPMKVPEERRAGFLGAVPVGLVEEVRPELIVGLDVFVEALMRSSAVDDYVRFRQPVYLEDDQRLARSETLWWSRYLNIFVRKDLLKPRTLDLRGPPVDDPAAESGVDVP